MKILKFLLIFILIIGWLFNYPPFLYENLGGLRIWQNPPAPLDKYLSGPFPPKVQVAQAQGNNGAMMVYAKAADTTPYYRTWNETAGNWSTEGSATAVSFQVR